MTILVVGSAGHLGEALMRTLPLVGHDAIGLDINAGVVPRDVRLSLPTAPGIYRMLRTDGSVLYVGKAASLHHRVNSYFRKQAGVPERSLEMLSQARAISFDVTPSPLEAALLEPDEIWAS